MGLSLAVANNPHWPYGGVAFTPSDLDDLELWLDAAQEIYQDSAKTTPAVSDGDPVGGWGNLGTGASDATQATTADKGTLRLSQVNGLPSVEFDGSSDYLAGTSIGVSGSEGFTLFQIYQYLAGANSVSFAFGAVANGEFRNSDPDNASARYTFGDGNRVFTVTPGTTYHLHTGHCTDGADYGNHEWRMDGIQLAEASSSNPTTVPDLTAEAYEICRNLLNLSETNGRMAEVIFYSRELNATERGQVETYLAAKYGISLP